MDEPKRLQIGSLGRAHGIRGEIRFFPYNPESELLEPGLEIYLPKADRTLTVERARPTDDFVIVAFAEIDDRTQAESLTNLEVEVDEDVLPAPDDGEVYQKDLVGLEVALSDDDGGEERVIGEIAGFFATGANDVMVVDLDDGGELYVPVVDAAIAVLTPERGAVLHPLDRWAPEDTEL